MKGHLGILGGCMIQKHNALVMQVVILMKMMSKKMDQMMNGDDDDDGSDGGGDKGDVHVQSQRPLCPFTGEADFDHATQNEDHSNPLIER